MSEKLTWGNNAARRRPRCGARLLLALISLTLAFVELDVAEGKRDPPPVITIGVVGPMSGDMANVGRYVREAVAQQADEWNERGGIMGRRIQLLIEDDQNDPTGAAAAAKRLVRAGVWGVIGHLTSAGSLPASVIYHKAGIPQITPSSTDPRLTEQGFGNLFRTCGRDDQQGRVAAEFVLDVVRPRHVVVLHDRTPYGRALAEAFQRRLSRQKRDLIVDGLSFSPGGKDLAPVIQAIKAKAADLVYFGGIYREGGLLLRQLREQGVKATLVSGDGVIGTEFVQLAGEAAAAGTYLTFAPNSLSLPSADPVIKRFQLRYGGIGPYTLYAYDAAGALFTAIAKSRPKAPSRPHLLRISRTFHQMTYTGALGQLRWDRKGDLVNPPYVIYQVKKGGSFQGWFEQVTDRPPQP